MEKVLKILIATCIYFFFNQTMLYADVTSDTQAVRATIAKIEAALSRYKIVNGKYPESGSKNLANAIYPDYNSFEPNEIREDLIVDPWGYAFVYRKYHPGINFRWHTYEIYSVGPNGADEDGNRDDIGNW